MSSYAYPANTITFGARDLLALGDPEKIVSGVAYDLEFNGITAGKLDKNGNDFEGTIGNPLATIDGGEF